MSPFWRQSVHFVSVAIVSSNEKFTCYLRQNVFVLGFLLMNAKLISSNHQSVGTVTDSTCLDKLSESLSFFGFLMP